MLDNIPAELKALPQWCCAYDGGAPVNPKTKGLASPTNPDTWGTFDEAVAAGLPYVGLVLTENDPYTIVDLDDKLYNPAPPEELERFEHIIEFFDTYTERSRSGRGYHVIMRASLGNGRRRGHVEVYDRWRFMIMTGNVYRDRSIEDRSSQLPTLLSQMPSNRSTKQDPDDDTGEVYSDAEIFDMAINAVNGDKYDKLSSGHWEGDYNSQSEADAALMTFLAYYSRSNAQCVRMFQMSPLGKREKSFRRDYLGHTLAKARIDEVPPLDTSDMMDRARAVVEQSRERTVPPDPVPTPDPVPQQPLQVKNGGIPCPPGLVGEVATYIYQSSDRPVWELSLVAALGFMAGITGRQYNVSGTGLNLYLIGLAGTGRGKEDMAKGIDRIVAKLRERAPTVSDYIGPAAFASGPALIKALDDQDTMMATVAEAGYWMQSMTGRNANDAKVTLKRALLDLYSKSGWGQALRSSVYSDKEKNTKTVYSPALTIVGDATPESFYTVVDETIVMDGLMPRFTIIEYTGPRVRRNRNARFAPTPQLVDMIGQVVAAVGAMHANNTCQEVGYEPNALNLLDQFDEMCDDRINESSGAVAELWNRAHLKALKLAGLLAVGCNYNAPLVTTECAQWAIGLVEFEAGRIVQRFQTNEVGEGEHVHESELRGFVEKYMSLDAGRRAGNHKCPRAMSDDPVIPYSSIRDFARHRSSFKNDKRGLARAIDSAILDLVNADVLAEMAPSQVKEKYGMQCRQKVYGIGNGW